jgi:hypothetical protein
VNAGTQGSAQAQKPAAPKLAKVGDQVVFHGYGQADAELTGWIARLVGQAKATLMVIAPSGHSTAQFMVDRDDTGVNEGTWRLR